MATHKIGFLKFNTSDDGIAFRIGDGKIHRIGFGKKRGQDAEETYDDAYMDDQAYVDDAYPADDDAAVTGGYTGRFASRGRSASRYDDYGDDYGGYDEDGYPDDRYADDDYAEDDYAEDGYSDDGYYDDDYAEGDYDDRYSDEDAGGYDDDPGYGSENPLMRYIDENDWVTYALLVLLPPLGIYLLWRRRRFETPIRWIVSAASGVWFVILLILLISAILAGGGDAKTNPPITMNPPATAQPSVGPSAAAGGRAEQRRVPAGERFVERGAFGQRAARRDRRPHARADHGRALARRVGDSDRRLQRWNRHDGHRHGDDHGDRPVLPQQSELHVH